MMNLGNRISQHNFATVPQVNMARSTFDRSYTRKTTMDFDYLVPVFFDLMYPGDTVNLNMSTFARLATQKVPIMDNLYVDYHFFAVPCRLLQTNFEKLMGYQANPGDSITYTLPTLDPATAGTGFLVGSIYDYFALPTGVPGYVVKNTLFLRAYNLSWNSWYRDENLQNSVTENKDDGPDQIADYALLKRGKRFDYFTSCLTAPQKGIAVTIGMSGTAPVLGIGKKNQTYPDSNVAVYESDGTTSNYATATYIDASAANNQVLIEQNASTGYPNVRADLSLATAISINDLRQAILMQSFLELAARGGTRYVEVILSNFNVVSPDFRLQRPEYLGGGSQRINSHVVPQTSPTSGSNAQAALASFATAGGGGIGFSKSFTEHTVVIGLACARADITYQQGLNRLWNMSTRFDFFWPKFQGLGEQAVLKKEIMCVGTGGATDEDVFGYQERDAHLRFRPSEITGKFRSTYATPLDQWHMAEEFGSVPSLNSTFITQSTPIDRAIAVSSEPHMLMDIWFKYIHTRPMVAYAVPATLGRF